MTIPFDVSLEVSPTSVLKLVVATGSSGKTYCYVPTINDQIVSESNPMPVNDPVTQAAVATISPAVDALSSPISAGLSLVTTAMNNLISAVNSFVSSPPPSGGNGGGSSPPPPPPGNSVWTINSLGTLIFSISNQINFNPTVLNTTGGIIVLYITAEPANLSNFCTITSISDTSGLTWNRRGGVSWESNSTNMTTEIWWAYASGVTNTTITINFSENFDDAAMVGVQIYPQSGTLSSGADPWDTNSSLPASSTVTGVLTVSDVSSDCNEPTVLAVIGTAFPDGVTWNGADGWSTPIQASNSGALLWAYTTFGYDALGTQLSSETITVPASSNNQATIVDCLNNTVIT